MHSAENGVGAPALTLYYLDHPFWRAECVRVALFGARIPFRDARLSWEDLEASGRLTFGTFPALEVDGRGVIAQTQAIASYVGKLTGLYPSDDFLAAKVDEALDGLTDATELVTASMRERDPARKVAWRQALIAPEGRLTQMLTGLERMLVANGSCGHFAGDQLSIADLAVWRAWSWMTGGSLDGIPPDYMRSKFPQLTFLHSTVDNTPVVKDWKEQNPRHYRK